MNSLPTYIIAEAGVNHNGNVELAYKLIDAAKQAGADAVKFQTFKTENILTSTTSLAEYQANNVNSPVSQYQMIKNLELTYDDFIELKKHAENSGIDFLSTPDDDESLDFLVDILNLPLIKIGSGEVTNLRYLRRIASKQRPMILSTGMSTLGEVERAINSIRDVSGQNLTLLHCTTNYPCPFNEVNLRAMLTLKNAFNLPVGYSDHTIGFEVPIAAVVMGAQILEKHLTLDVSMDGPDHSASMNPIDFKDMVHKIRCIELAMGNGIKVPNQSEEKIKPFIRRRIVASKDIPSMTELNWEDLSFKRADYGIYAEDADRIISRITNRSISKDIPLQWDFFSEKRKL